MTTPELPIVTTQQTIHAMLERSRRHHVPLRRAFLRTSESVTSPPLSRIVRNRDERALDLYLLFLAQASGGAFDVSYPAAVWARALSLEGKNATTAVSKTLARLVKYNLVKRGRLGRQAHVMLLREDGSGEPYAPPFRTGESYLRLPHEYWLAAAPGEEEWYKRLTLAGKVALLVSLSFPRDFFLSITSARKQFGISPDTLGQGIRELRGYELLNLEERHRIDPLVAVGYRTVSWYRLQSPFSHEKGEDGEPERTAPSSVTPARGLLTSGEGITD